MTKPLDRVSRENFEAARRRARELGVDFADFLNRMGLLLTPARRYELIAKELRRTAYLLQNTDPSAIIQADDRNGYTALDMQRATVAWLRRRADEIEKD